VEEYTIGSLPFCKTETCLVHLQGCVMLKRDYVQTEGRYDVMEGKQSWNSLTGRAKPITSWGPGN
jgi:hypothetical protein